MDVDEDDDFYAPEESAPPGTERTSPEHTAALDANPEQEDEDLEEGEEEDDNAGSEGSDSVRSDV